MSQLAGFASALPSAVATRVAAAVGPLAAGAAGNRHKMIGAETAAGGFQVKTCQATGGFAQVVFAGQNTMRKVAPAGPGQCPQHHAGRLQHFWEEGPVVLIG